MKALYKQSTLIISTLLFTLLALCLSCNSAYSQSGSSFLTIKGDVTGDCKADIQVFQYVDSTDSWVSTIEKSNKSKFKFTLDPRKDYQVWFTNDTGLTKILYVESGNAGPWFKRLDVDFSPSCILYARMYQDPVIANYDYIVEQVAPGYVNQPIVAMKTERALIYVASTIMIKP